MQGGSSVTLEEQALEGVCVLQGLSQGICMAERDTWGFWLYKGEEAPATCQISPGS